MKRKLVSISALLLIAVALSFPTAPHAASATTIDCDLTGQLCRQISRRMYDLCIAMDRPADQCAYEEAQNTINCLATSGCPYKPPTSPPGSN